VLGPSEIVERDGQLVGVLDWEESGAGDPAVDVAGLHHLGDGEARDVVEVMATPAAELSRGRPANHSRVDGAAWSQRYYDVEELRESVANISPVTDEADRCRSAAPG
jgi:aminoglycoside phosphotransferase (APT) family kinase protein